MTPPVNVHTQTRLSAEVLAHAAMYTCIAENTTDLIIRYDAGRKRTYVSPSVRSVLGFEPDELLRGRVLTADERPTFFIHPDDTAYLAAAIGSVGPDRPAVRISGRDLPQGWRLDLAGGRVLLGRRGWRHAGGSARHDRAEARRGAAR